MERSEQRILVLAPTGRDASLAESVFRDADIPCHCCTDLLDVCEQLDAGAAALLIAEEALVPGQTSCLTDWLAEQAPWSDLPVLLLARRGADSAAVGAAMDRLGNVTVLDRPMRIATLVSVARSALRARQRQYQTRGHLAEREQVEALLRTNDRRKDEFLAILAHELRNPLAPISNSLHIFRLLRGTDPMAGRVGEMMERQVNHLVRLVDDLLEVSRITRGKIELRKEVVQVASVLRNAIEASRPLLDAAGHTLDVDLPRAPLLVLADGVRLAQVFSNLLNNAAKYTDPGGRIALSARVEGRDVAVSVRDTGTGIPVEMLGRVFEMFTQVEREAGRAQGGLGIGLTLVKNIVELHGGTVQAFSEGAGRGSEFVVRLPLAAAGMPEPPASASAGRGQLAGKRILVVDDNRDAASSLAHLLNLLGAEAGVAHDGAGALATLASRRHDLVLLDIGMPGMDGYEVARRIRCRPELRDLKVVALTGWGQEDDVRRSIAAGFDSHLIKPVDVATLEDLLHSLQEEDEHRAGTSA
jgi:two-component system, sensor histidine kinase